MSHLTNFWKYYHRFANPKVKCNGTCYKRGRCSAYETKGECSEYYPGCSECCAKCPKFDEMTFLEFAIQHFNIATDKKEAAFEIREAYYHLGYKRILLCVSAWTLSDVFGGYDMNIPTLGDKLSALIINYSISKNSGLIDEIVAGLTKHVGKIPSLDRLINDFKESKKNGV